MIEPAGSLRRLAGVPRVRFASRLLIGLLIGALSLVFVLRGADLAETGTALARTNFLWLLPALAALAVSIVAKALRWGLLFRPHHQPQPATLTAGILVGQTVNNALPVRLGEVVRVQYLADSAGTSRAFSLGTIGLEKALDSISLLGLFIVVVPFALLPSWVTRSGLIATIGIGVALIGAVILVVHRDAVRSLADFLAERLPFLGRLTESRRLAAILRSLDVLGEAGLLARALGYSALALLAGAVINACVLLALSPDDAPAVVPLSLFVLLVGYLGGAVPAAPGRIGIFQAVTMLSLAPFGIEGSAALSYSIVLYVIVIVLPTLAGVAILARHPFRTWAATTPDGAEPPVSTAASGRLGAE